VLKITDFNPPAITGYVGVHLGKGICKYTLNPSIQAYAMTGMAQLLYFYVPYAHRFMRLQCAQFVISSSAPDTTGLNLNLGKLDYYIGTEDILAATQGSIPYSCVIFDFPHNGYPVDATNYVIGVTGQNNDELTVEFIVQYLQEGLND
jgi:hypothetical protein